MNKLEKNFYQIPQEHREHLVKMLPWIKKQVKLQPGHEYTDYLFKLYNSYLCVGCNKTQDCGYCLSQVKHRMFLAAYTFEQYGTKDLADG